MPLLLALLQEGGHGAGGGPFSINPGLIIWTLVVFGILLVLLWRFAFPAILKSVEARERKIEKQLQDAERANAEAQRLLTETAGDLAFALSHVVHLCHPQVIVLGGGLSLIGNPLKESVAFQLEGFIMEAFRPGPSLSLSALGENSVPCGALLLSQKALG